MGSMRYLGRRPVFMDRAGNVAVRREDMPRPDQGSSFAGDDDGFEGDEDFEGEGEDFEGEGEGDEGTELGRRKKKKKGNQGQSQRKPNPSVKWQQTVLAGSVDLAAAGNASIQIRVQHNFRAEALTFEGSLAGATIQSIMFGDRTVWSVAGDGVSAAVFAPTSNFLRGVLQGQSINAGLDITINGTLPGAGTLAVTISGAKPIVDLY